MKLTTALVNIPKRELLIRGLQGIILVAGIRISVEAGRYLTKHLIS